MIATLLPQVLVPSDEYDVRSAIVAERIAVSPDEIDRSASELSGLMNDKEQAFARLGDQPTARSQVPGTAELDGAVGARAASLTDLQSRLGGLFSQKGSDLRATGADLVQRDDENTAGVRGAGTATGGPARTEGTHG